MFVNILKYKRHYGHENFKNQKIHTKSKSAVNFYQNDRTAVKIIEINYFLSGQKCRSNPLTFSFLRLATGSNYEIIFPCRVIGNLFIRM